MWWVKGCVFLGCDLSVCKVVESGVGMCAEQDQRLEFIRELVDRCEGAVGRLRYALELDRGQLVGASEDLLWSATRLRRALGSPGVARDADLDV